METVGSVTSSRGSAEEREMAADVRAYRQACAADDGERISLADLRAELDS